MFGRPTGKIEENNNTKHNTTNKGTINFSKMNKFYKIKWHKKYKMY